ncbi:MAG: hypothetical protein C0622_09165, partial [Desulfuromonas sp.]
DSSYLYRGQRLNLDYELGLLYERMDRPEDALHCYEDLMGQDSHYRDVADKVEELKKAISSKEEQAPSDAAANKQRISFL